MAKQKKNFIKYIKAFSLIEVMLSLIILSIVTAAVVPVITKKITGKSIKIEAEENNEESEYTTDCQDLIIDGEKVGPNCTICTKGEDAVCKQCPIECDEGMLVNIAACKCVECKAENCEECQTENKCFKCMISESGVYYSNNGNCEICPLGHYCDGIEAIPCPKGSYSNDALGSQACTACPKDTYFNPEQEEGATSDEVCLPCPGNQYADQGSLSCTECKSTDEGNCACTKADDTCVRCKDGYNLNNNGVCVLSEQGG